MRLHFKDYGRGMPLVLLHGMFGSLDNWHTVSRQLAARFHIFAVDQRNHGRSPHSREMSYALMAEDLLEFLDEHSLASAHVLGHSMGGKTAMQFALSFPGRTGKLIIEDIAPRAYPPTHGQVFDGLLSLNPGAFQSRRQVEAVLSSSIPELTVRRFLLKNLGRDASGALRWKLGLRNISNNYGLLNAAVAATRPFGNPALFIRGGNSDYVQERDFESLRHSFPRVEIRTIPDAGHWVHADAPAPFVEIVQRFLLSD